MKKIINSKYFKRFRKSFLKTILDKIENYEDKFCCHVFTWHRLFICWKDLKEVQENLNSEYIWKSTSDSYSCNNVWFIGRENRMAFLKECISKIN